MQQSFDSNVEIGSRDLRRVYLITYSQADVNKFPTRQSFANAVLAAFAETNVVHWCCSKEHHQKSGVHYHMSVKLSKCQRWLPAKKFLADQFGISVHFSSIHANYYTAWKYVTKEDDCAEESKDHPDLSTSKGPRTMNAHMAIKTSRKRCVRPEMNIGLESDNEDSLLKEDPGLSGLSGDDEIGEKSKKEKKRKRLSAFEFSEIIVSKGLKSRTDVLALAHMQKNEGKTDMAEFIVNRGSKVVNEVLRTAWEMEEAKAAQERTAKSRLEILQEARGEPCTCKQASRWHALATELLEHNGISCKSFARAVKELLCKGRGKYRNIMLTGPANCGKTFLLNPLNSIFQTFTNPATTSFAWIGAEEAEVIFLNDFRWSPQVIPWHDLLLLLEGQLVHLPAPKSHFAKDMVFDRDTPIFATSKYPLVFVKNGMVDERETEMMTVRWRTFTLNWQIPEAKQQEMVACSTCFARLILENVVY